MVSCNVDARHARGRGRAERGRTARNVAQRTRTCCAAPFATRERAADCAARFLLAAEVAARVSAAYSPHALQNAVLLCTNGQIGVLRRTRDVAVLDAGHTGCDVRFYCEISICVGGDSDLAQAERSGVKLGKTRLRGQNRRIFTPPDGSSFAINASLERDSRVPTPSPPEKPPPTTRNASAGVLKRPKSRPRKPQCERRPRSDRLSSLCGARIPRPPGELATRLTANWRDRSKAEAFVAEGVRHDMFMNGQEASADRFLAW